MSRREEFKTRMKALKLYRDTTGKGYWEWKVLALYEGGDTQEPERVRITSDTDLTEFSKSMKDFANWWYNERNKLAKYLYLLQNIDEIHNRINNSKYLSGQDIAPIILKDNLLKLYELIQGLPENDRNTRYNLISELLMKGKAGFSYPDKGVYTSVKNRGIMYHEGIGHIVGDTTPEILNITPIKLLNKDINVNFEVEQDKYNNYINLKNERHAQLWLFRGDNLNVQDDKGYIIDPNRQVTPDEIKTLREARKLRLPQEWINSGMTDEDIANLHNTVAENTTTKDNEVFSGKNGGEIPSYEGGGDTEYNNLMTTIATNALRDAANRGDRALVEKILKAKIGEPKEFYYPDSGAITPFLNIYDLPIIGDAFSLADATRSLVYKDYDNAAMLYLNAVLPAAILGKSKLNWKEWNLKKKYIPEYEAIEREAKKNGTWLKNEDGTDFTGDAREWVAKRSKRFKDVFGDDYKEGYTGMRNPYDPNLTTDTYLGSKDRAYTYTLNKGTVKKKGDIGIAKLVVPNTDTYTVDALGNDWLHLTDKSINPYNFTNTNLIVSKITTPTISFKNIRDDGPFGMRDIAEDQFVIKANTPKKSILYNNGDFDLSNPDIFKTSLVPYIGYKLYNKANREDIPSYIDGGDTKEIEETNSNSTPSTVNEYITLQILNIRQSALNKSRIRKLPKVPIKYSESELQYQKRNQEYIRSLESELLLKKDLLEYNRRKDSMLQFGYESDQTKLLQLQIEDLLNKISIGILRNGEILGPSCAATFADNYNMDFIGSELFRLNALKYGFKQKDFKDRKPGDAVLVYNTNTDKATHTMMYDSDINGVPTYNHSNGGTDSLSLRVRGKYPFKEGTIPLIYEYVGSPADSIRWHNEFKTRRYTDGGETEKTEIPDIYNTLTKEQKNRIVSAGREYTLIDPLVLLTETGVRDYSNEINTYLNKGYLEFDAGYLPEVTIGPRSRFYIPLETYYPFISDYPYTGHSEIPCFVDWGGDDLGYNLVTNNCSDKTREALEYTFNKKINPFLFTTPGDVRDFAIKLLNGIKVPTGYDYDVESDKFVKIAKPKKGMNKVLIPASVEQYKKFKDYALNNSN